MFNTNRTTNQFWRRNSINVELTYKCSLVCPACPRQTAWKDSNIKLVGEELSLESYTKIVKFFKNIQLCGQLSDPLHHSQFHRILEITNEYDPYSLSIHTAVSLPSIDFYREAFKIRPNKTNWVFGIDGLPKDSHKYRINQDGEKLFNIMLECAKKCDLPPIWQYIVFSYNEKDMEEAESIAKKYGIRIQFLHSSRWLNWRTSTSPVKFIPNIGPKVKTSTPTGNSIDTNSALPATFKHVMNLSGLDPECYNSKPFGTDAWGRLLPCCRVDNVNHNSDPNYNELMSVSKISECESIEEILLSEPWQNFFNNLKKDKGFLQCHRMCSTDSSPNNIIIENGSRVIS